MYMTMSTFIEYDLDGRHVDKVKDTSRTGSGVTVTSHLEVTSRRTGVSTLPLKVKGQGGHTVQDVGVIFYLFREWY